MLSGPGSVSYQTYDLKQASQCDPSFLPIIIIILIIFIIVILFFFLENTWLSSQRLPLVVFKELFGAVIGQGP